MPNARPRFAFTASLALLLASALACDGGTGSTRDAAGVDGPSGSRDSTGLDAELPRFVPGNPMLLSSDSPGRDEDPFVLRAHDDWIYVAWYSERNGSGDIYLRRTRDGVAWSEAIQISSTPDVDFYPSLYQDDAGVFHAAWFRRVGNRNGRGHIVYTHTSDPLHWDTEVEVDVTAPTGQDNDWTPSLVQTPAGSLLIAFARDHCFPQAQPCFSLKTTVSGDGMTWSSPAPLLDVAAAQDHLPFLLRTGTTLTAVWNRYAADATLPYLTPTTDVLAGASSDGQAWSLLSEVTANDAEGVMDVFPTAFLDHDGTPRMLWLEASTSSQRVVERAIGGIGPTAPLAALPATGYSHHVVATPTPGTYLGAWVAGTEPAQDVYVGVFTR